MNCYVITFSTFAFRELGVASDVGLAVEHRTSYYRTTMSYSLAEAQRVRQELIARGCDPEKLRIEYA